MNVDPSTRARLDTIASKAIQGRATVEDEALVRALIEGQFTREAVAQAEYKKAIEVVLPLPLKYRIAVWLAAFTILEITKSGGLLSKTALAIVGTLVTEDMEHEARF